MGKSMWLETRLDEGNRRTRLMHSFYFSSLLKESPYFEKNGLILAAVTHFYTFILALWYARTHKRTPTHAVTHQWRGKQRHLEKSSSGRHWHDLRGLTAFPIALVVQHFPRWLPSAFGVASDGCTTNWRNTSVDLCREQRNVLYRDVKRHVRPHNV